MSTQDHALPIPAYMPAPTSAIATPRVNKMRAFLTTRTGLYIGRFALLALFLLGWELASGTLIPKFWVSRPSAIFAMIRRWAMDGSLWSHLQATFSAAAIGYVVGAASGALCGLVLGFLPRAERVFSPFLTAFYCLPKIALAPLFVILFGVGLESKIVLVAITVFFLVLYNTLDGIRDTDRDLTQALGLMGATRREIALKVLLPGTMPWVFNALRIAVRYAFTAAILGELISGNRGIGFLIEYSAANFNSAGVFGAVFLLVVASVLVTEVITRSEASQLRWRM